MKNLLTPKNISLLAGVAVICTIGVIAYRTTAQTPGNAAKPGSAGQGMRQQMRRSRPKPAENVSDKELKTFFAVNQEMRSMQMGAQKKMQKAITDQGLSPQRYNTIARSQMDTSMESDASEKELKKAEKASKKMRTIQRDINAKSTEIIKEEGMKPTRYQQIGMALRQDKQLQKRYEQMRQEQTKGSMKRQMPPTKKSAPVPSQ